VVHLPEQQLAPLVRPPPLGDVAGDLGRANDFACRVSDWRYRQGDINQASVLPPPNRFVVLDPFAAADALGSSFSRSLGMRIVTGQPITSSGA